MTAGHRGGIVEVAWPRGLRREGNWRRERLACTVFLAGGDGKRECRVCELDRAADEIARATRVMRAQRRNRKEPRMVLLTVVQSTTMAIASIVEQLVIVIIVVVVVVVIVVVVAMVADIRLAPFPR